MPLGEKLVKWCVLKIIHSMIPGRWSSFRQHGSQVGSRLKVIQPGGRQKEERRTRRQKKIGRSKLKKRAKVFPLSLNRISKIVN